MPTTLTGRQRQYLKGLAHGGKVPLCQIGANGLSDAAIKDIEAVFRSHELIKVQFLEKGEIDRFEYAEQLAQRTGAAVVQVIGFKAVLYRPNPEKPRIKLPEAGQSIRGATASE